MTGVTAILQCYLRTKFIDQALSSIVEQESNHGFELVIVQTRPDFEIPRQTERKAKEIGIEVRLVTIPKGPSGLGLAAGLKASTGDVVAFIDDDDLWEQGKIRRVESIFEEDQKATFLHNGQTFVDSANRSLAWWKLHRLVRHPASLIPEGRGVVAESRRFDLVRSLLPFEPDFNGSSMALRRDVLTDKLDALSRLDGADDSFFFYSALAKIGNLHVTSDRLTRYRVHRESATSGFTDSAAGLESKSIARYASLHLRELELVRTSLLADCLPEVAQPVFERERALWSTLFEVETTARREDSLARRIRALTGSGRLGWSPRELSTIALLCGAAANPRLARALYSASRRRW
jgi:glycosyltransferase involved in cell wall biosynthesis